MSPRRVVAVVPDLFFATRILSTAVTLGVAVESVPPERALEAIRGAPPDLVILDLHAPGDPLALARALRADPATAKLPVLGFHSHVDRALRQAALEAGVDPVLPRSAFTVRLAELLAGEGRTRS
jgi:CheY-like chemotaxis protein